MSISTSTMKRAKTGYNVFVTEKFAEIKAASKEPIVFVSEAKKIGMMWGKLTVEEKLVYANRAKICSGVKADGTPCTHKAKKNLQFCGYHVPNKTEKKSEKKTKCVGVTASGVQCSRNARSGKTMCQMHIKKSAKTE